MTIERGLLDANRTHLYYESTGTGEPVVLIHGFALDRRMWDDQFSALAPHYRVVRYDQRGFGNSALPDGAPYSHVEDLGALLDHLDIPSAHLIGLSKRGAIAIDFALTYPERARSLVLIDTVLGGFSWSPEGSARDSLVWQSAREGGIPAAKQSWLTHPLFVPAQRQPEVAARLARITEAYSGWHFVNRNPEQWLDPPAAQCLGELRMPVLAICGELDTPDFRAITDLVCHEVTHARKLIVPDVGHMANMEAPDQVTSAIRSFLAKV